jgi:integrase
MGCLCRDPKSNFWYWAWRDAAGRRLKTSTKIPALGSLREEAKEVGRSFEKIDELARRNAAVDDQLRKLIAKTLEQQGKPPLDDPTLAEWLTRWLASLRGAVSVATIRRYQDAIDAAKRILGERANVRLSAITGADILGFRDTLQEEGRSAKTVNLLVGVIRHSLKAAVEEELLEREPGRGVKNLKAADVEKVVFSPSEVVRLADAAEGEWKTLVLSGYFTGQRIGDIIRLTWNDIDLHKNPRRILFRQRKNNSKKVPVPIHPELAEHLERLPLPPDNADQSLFPCLSKIEVGGYDGLSHRFSALMEKAGIANAVTREREGKHGRTTRARTFHVLRHSFISAMMNADVPAEDRQLLAGHSSSKIHQGYSHADWQKLDKAVQKIERLPKGTM